jgi:hypothetical protein
MALGELETKYLAALQRAFPDVPEADTAAWAAEIKRVKSAAPLPPPDAALPAELARLQSIYRRELAGKSAAAPPDPAAREIELFVMADDQATVLLNGAPVDGDYLSGSAESPGALRKITLTLKPGDVLGFHCSSSGGQKYFRLIARAGVRILFASSERWEATQEPAAAWLKGDGPAATRPRVLRGRLDFDIYDAARFESAARAHSVDYHTLWCGEGAAAGFRYRIRAVDLPDKPVPRMEKPGTP